MTYELIDGGIADGGGILYDAHTISDLTPAAKDRLVELCNHPDYAGWEWAARFLIAEGLYTESEADNDL
jgi:hypothetical protein